MERKRGKDEKKLGEAEKKRQKIEKETRKNIQKAMRKGHSRRTLVKRNLPRNKNSKFLVALTLLCELLLLFIIQFRTAVAALPHETIAAPGCNEADSDYADTSPPYVEADDPA